MPYAGQAIRQRVQLGRRPDDCWLWLGPTGENGHGHLTFGGRVMLAHRWMWEQLFGPIPDGAVVYTTCETRGCVNPHHLACDNYAAACRARSATKLSARDVAEIRAAREGATPTTVRALSLRFEVSVTTVRDIWAGRSWTRQRKPRSVPGPRAEART